MFITRFGLFEYLITNFKIIRTPSLFQYYINYTLFDLFDKYITTYLNDILIYSSLYKEYRRYIKEVIIRLRDIGFIINIRKYEFEIKETKYLRLIISNKSVRINLKKVVVITSQEAPRILKNLQQFIDFSNFYRQFIKSFSKIVLPLISYISRNKQRLFNEEVI